MFTFVRVCACFASVCVCASNSGGSFVCFFMRDCVCVRACAFLRALQSVDRVLYFKKKEKHKYICIYIHIYI